MSKIYATYWNSNIRGCCQQIPRFVRGVFRPHPITCPQGDTSKTVLPKASSMKICMDGINYIAMPPTYQKDLFQTNRTPTDDEHAHLKRVMHCYYKTELVTVSREIAELEAKKAAPLGTSALIKLALSPLHRVPEYIMALFVCTNFSDAQSSKGPGKCQNGRDI